MIDILKQVVELEHEAAAFGFEWETARQILQQIRSECDEVEEHLQAAEHTDRDALQEEIGDALHAIFSLCVFCKFEPRDTLDKTLTKFARRLHEVKRLTHAKGLVDLKDHSFDELMGVWEQAKVTTRDVDLNRMS
jgi:uncharacterized protein YabN with tetrapyrrole methylase and pyrophosphatase domain